MAKKTTKTAEVAVENTSGTSAKKLILRPHVTEKASFQSNVNAYTVEVDKSATKLALVAEIKRDHNVAPIKINITQLPPRKVFVRGKVGVVAGIKKAVIFLKKGDTLKLA